jgi:hypothetical protein
MPSLAIPDHHDYSHDFFYDNSPFVDGEELVKRGQRRLMWANH